MRQAARWFQNSQTSSVGDLLKWSLRGENRAIQETAAQLVELNMVWSDVQKSFCGNATHIPIVTVSANGRINAISTVAVTATDPSAIAFAIALG